MRIEQLVSFKRVADERSYTRAAEKEFLTQPAIYSQVRQLEVESGSKLFFVDGKEVLLTQAGKDLYRLAEAVAAANAEYLAASRGRKEARTHEVRIGALSYFGILGEATERLRLEDPHCVVHFQSMHPTEAIELIRGGVIDFGFFGDGFITEGLVFEQCAVNKIIAVVPPGHRLAGRKVTFAQLAEYPLVGYATGSAKAAIDKWLATHPDEAVTFAAQSDSSHAVKAMALAMGCPALVVQPAIAGDLSSGMLIEVEVSDFEASYPLFAVYSSLEELGRGAQRYRDHLLAEFKSKQPPSDVPQP